MGEEMYSFLLPLNHPLSPPLTSIPIPLTLLSHYLYSIKAADERDDPPVAALLLPNLRQRILTAA